MNLIDHRTCRPALVLAIVLLTSLPSSADVDRIKIIVENDPQKPGRAQVYFPHLSQWIAADHTGIIKLPSPYGDLELITVNPSLREIYGPSFRRTFPVRDGVISLRAIPVTQAIKAKAIELVNANKPAEAATAFALTANREKSLNQSEALRNERLAYEALARKYRVPNPYIEENNTLRASPQLVSTINLRVGPSIVPSDGRFTVDDFRQAAQMKNYTPIIAEAQKSFFKQF